MTRKPRLFIGSSVEGLSVGDAINLNLDHEIEVTLGEPERSILRVQR